MGGDGDAGLGTRRGMGEIEVGLLLDGGIIGADEGEEGFDVEEKVFVDWSDLRCTGCHDGGLIAKMLCILTYSMYSILKVQSTSSLYFGE